MSKTFCIGDIHGGHKALLQVLERSKFDYENDKLICLGDVADGWDEVKECFNELLKIKNLIYILGNHDEWFLDWAISNWQEDIWVSQGGRNTMQSYDWQNINIPKSHIELLQNSKLYYLDDENRLFVHGGIIPYKELNEIDNNVFLWDRELIQNAYRLHVHSNYDPNIKMDNRFKEIFVGHTTTQWWNNNCTPICYSGVWDLDTGCGWSGKLTIMNIDTHEFWQSDKVPSLYPNVKGRG